MILADASVLIVLGKLRRLDLLRALYGKVVIGPMVKREVVDQGRAIGAPGLQEVEAAIRQGWLQVVQPAAQERNLARRLLTNSRLHEGEAESLALAQKRNLTLLVDDKEGRMIAEALGIPYHATAGVLLEAFMSDEFTLKELEQAVTDLSNVMWLSPAVVVEILSTARETKK